jgi:hypothetical protein
MSQILESSSFFLFVRSFLYLSIHRNGSGRNSGNFFVGRQKQSTPGMSSDSPLIGPKHSVGPERTLKSYGDETTVVRMHSGNGEHDEMNRRAIGLFDQALVDVGLVDDGVRRQVLHDYFTWATTTAMSR